MNKKSARGIPVGRGGFLPLPAEDTDGSAPETLGWRFFFSMLLGAIAAVFDLVCPSCTHSTAPGQVEGDKCESCGAPIKLDCLSGFHRTTATLASEPDETS